ncbi:hypothetical protein HRbin33_01431 [bacterium HR33]|nr:hypothetical protein HRbin33_01431 [bacterium HR33]
MEVFVNEGRVELAPGAVVRDALSVRDPALLEAVLSGAGYVTDGVGRKIGLDDPLAEGSILRVVLSARGRSGKLFSTGGGE